MYFEVKEPVETGEPMELARQRAQERLKRLSDDFVALARQHGLP